MAHTGRAQAGSPPPWEGKKAEGAQPALWLVGAQGELLVPFLAQAEATQQAKMLPIWPGSQEQAALALWTIFTQMQDGAFFHRMPSKTVGSFYTCIQATLVSHNNVCVSHFQETSDSGSPSFQGSFSRRMPPLLLELPFAQSP